MEFFVDLYLAVRDHPREVLVCIAVPAVLAFIFRGDGVSGGWFDGDSDGDGGD